MCGFAGCVDFLVSTPHERLAAAAERMNARLVHRGPDAGGVWIDAAQGVALGHRRLSILDLSANGHQPMVSRSGRWVLAYNGETYNHGRLRDELAREGHGFRGRSDTEVLLAAIEAWGVRRALERAEGMLAFACWDRLERAIYLARDRLGKKPLYFGWSGHTLLFGSELHALSAHESFAAEIDRAALALYMRHNCVPAPRSIYRGVWKLPPGSFVRITAEVGPAREWEDVERRVDVYWSAATEAARGAADPFTGTETEALDELDALLKTAVRERLVSDVPVGAFLSGGVDSALVVALMQATGGARARTFTIGSADPVYDESSPAREVANRLGAEHTELIVAPERALEAIERLPALYDEPFADSSQIPTLLVSHLAREQVTVALSGDGGDEVFGGYNRHAWSAPLWRTISGWPLSVRRGAAHLLTSVSPERWDRLFETMGGLLPARARQRMAGYKLHKLARVLTVSAPAEMYVSFTSHWHDPASVVLGAVEPRTLVVDPERWPELRSVEERMMLLDLISYLPDDILVKVDRASMSVGLEVRCPLLDLAVSSFAWRLPLSMKVREGRGKWLLRELLHRYLPPSMTDRPKGGFGLPLDAWLRGPLRDWAEAWLDERTIRTQGYFDPVPIRERWREHQSGARDWQYEIWDVLMFQAWLGLGQAAPFRTEAATLTPCFQG